MQEQFYTPQQIAEMLQIDIRTVYRKLRGGELKGIKLSHRTWRVRGKDLEAYLENLESR